MRPTAREIALHCGVSVATVSRVLNSNYKNGFSVSKDLYKKITKTAEELGYRPNLAARNLAQQKTKIVAFIGLNTSYAWPSDIYQHTCETAIRLLQSRGYNICLVAPNLETDNTELPPWRVDGAIVVHACKAETINEMERIQLPYVMVNGTGGPSCSSIVLDDVNATKNAIDYLVDLGHKRIAYAGPSPEHQQHVSIGNRHRTYLAELTARGLGPISGHETLFTSGLDFLVSAVLKQKSTAIIAYDYVIAMKILHDASVLNIEIPKQVSLICLNDEKLCGLVVPPLTTVGIPSVQMGRMAAEMLLEKLESSPMSTPGCVKLAQDLVIRSSTADPSN